MFRFVPGSFLLLCFFFPLGSVWCNKMNTQHKHGGVSALLGSVGLRLGDKGGQDFPAWRPTCTTMGKAGENGRSGQTQLFVRSARFITKKKKKQWFTYPSSPASPLPPCLH